MTHRPPIAKKATRTVFLKSLSLTLILCLLIQEFSYSAPELLKMDLGWRIEDGGEKQKNLKWAKNLLPEIPESVATIEDAYQVPQGSDPRHQSVGGQASGTKTVILIQDAHTNTSCQLNESKLFAILFSHAPSKQAGGTPTVFTEAAQGNVNLTFLRDKASLFKRKQIANEYLQKGLLHGIEYLDLTSDHNFKIEGVEDPALYFKSLQVYKDSVKKRDSFDRYLTEIESTISVLKSKLLNPFLLSFLNTKDKQKDNLSDYIQTLINQAQILNLDLSKYPTIQHLQSLKALESKIDFKLASAEQQKATQSLSVEDQKELSSLSVSKLTMKDSQRGFFLLLEEKLKDQIKNYPNLSQYFKYLDQSKSLSPKDLLNEQKSLESQVLKALATNQDEEKLLLSIKTLSYYKKLFFLTLTPEEYQDSKQENFTDLKVLSGFLNQKLMNLKDHYDKAIFLKEDFTDIQNLCTQFYELTYQRDQAFISNMFKVIENTPYPAMGDTEPGRPFTRSEELHEDKWAGAVAGPVAAHKYILITGGYHTPNLKHLLRQHSISYISITPQVTQETNVKRYEEILLSQPVPTTQQLAFNATATTMDMTGYTLPATTPSSAIPGPMESAKLISELEKQAPTVNKQSRIKNGRSPRRVVTRSFNQSGARLAEQSNVPSSGVPEKDQLHSGPYEIQLWQWALNFAETFLSNQKRKKTLIQVLKSYVTRDPIKSAASKVAHDILSLKDLEAIRGWSDALDRLVQSAPELEDIRILDSHEGVARELLKATWAYLLVYREEFNSSRRDFLKMTAATAVSMHISPYQQLMSPRLVDVPGGKSLSSLLWDELHASVRRNANLRLELVRTGSDKARSLFYFTWGNDNTAARDALHLFHPKIDFLPDPRFDRIESERRQRAEAINRTDPAIFNQARRQIVDYDRLVDLVLRLPASVVRAFQETNRGNWQERLADLEGGTPSITAIRKRELAEEIDGKEDRLKNLQKSLSTLQDDLIASPMHQDFDLYNEKYARQKNFLQIKIRDLNESIKNLKIQLDYFNSEAHSWLSFGARMAKEEVRGLAGRRRTNSTVAQNPYAFGDDTSIPDQWHENLSWISRVQQLALIYMAITFLFHDPFLMISRGWSAWGFASVASAMAVVSPWIRYGSVLLYVGTLAEIWRQFRQTNREIELFRLENTKDFVWQNKQREDYYESEIREALRNNMGPLADVPLYIRESGNVFSNLLFSIPFLGLWSLYFFTLYLNSDMAKNTIGLQTAIQKVILRRNTATVNGEKNANRSDFSLVRPNNVGARLSSPGNPAEIRLKELAQIIVNQKWWTKLLTAAAAKLYRQDVVGAMADELILKIHYDPLRDRMIALLETYEPTNTLIEPVDAVISRAANKLIKIRKTRPVVIGFAAASGLAILDPVGVISTAINPLDRDPLDDFLDRAFQEIRYEGDLAIELHEKDIKMRSKKLKSKIKKLREAIRNSLHYHTAYVLEAELIEVREKLRNVRWGDSLERLLMRTPGTGLVVGNNVNPLTVLENEMLANSGLFQLTDEVSEEDGSGQTSQGARLAPSDGNRHKRLGLMATPKTKITKLNNSSMPLILTSLLALIFGVFLFVASKFTTFIAEVAKLHENGPPEFLQTIDPSKDPKITESIASVGQPSEPFVKLETPSESPETPVVDQTSPDDDAIEILPVEPKQISQGFDLFTHMAYSSLSSGDSFTPMTQAYTDSTSFSGDPRRSGEYEITVKVVGILAELSGHSTADEIFLVDAFNDLEEGKLKRTGTVKLRPQGEPTGEEVKVKIIIPSLTEGQKMQLPNLPNGRVKVLNSQRYGISIDASGLMNANKPLSGRVQITYVIEKMSETSFVEGEVPLSAWLQKEIEAIPEPIKKELESVRNGTDRQKLEKIAQIFNTYTAYQTGKMEIKLPSGMTWGKYWDNNLKQYKRFLTNCGPLSLEAFIMTRAVGMKSYFFLSYANQPNSWLITSNEAHATTEVEMDGQMIVFEPTIFSPLLVGDPRSLLATHDLNWEVRKQSLTPEQNNQSDLAEKVSKAAEEATKEASGEISAGEKKEVPDQKVSEHRSKMFDVSPEIRAQMTGQVGQAAPGDSQSRSVSGSGGFSISTGNLRLSSPAEFEAFMKALQELGRVETTELEPWKLQDLLTRLKDSDEAVVFKALVEISNARAASVYGAAYPEIAQILRETILSDQPVYIRTQAIKAYLEIGELPELIPENAEFLAWLRVGVDYHPRRTPSWKDLQMSEVFREEYIRRLVLITTRIRLDSPKSKTSVEALTEMGDHPLIVSALLEMYVYRGGWLLSDSYPLWEIHNYFFRRKEVALDLGRSDYLMNAIPDTPDRVRDLTNFLILRTIAEYARDESVHENLIAVAEEAEKRLKAMDRKTALDALVQVVTADPIPIERKGEKGFSMYDDLSTYWSLDFKMHVLKFLQGFEDWNQGGVGDAVYNSLKPDVAEGTSLRRRPGATNESVQHAIGLFGEVGTMDDLPLLLDALKDEFQSSGRRIAKDEYGYNLARTILRIVFRKTNPQEWWSWLEERPDADEILIHLLHVADDEAKNRVLVDGISYGDRVKAELMRRKASSVPALLDALRNPIRNPAGQIADILRQLNITEAVPLISANLLAVFASDVESSKVYDYSYKTNYYESDSPRTWDMNLEINALGSLGTPEALETLLNIVSHPHASIRHQIIPYLKPAHHEKAVELLLTAALNRTKLEREYSYINNIAAWVNSILEIPTEDAAKAAIRVLSEKILPVSSEENALYGYEDISQVLISLSHSRWPVAQEFLASMAKKSPSQYYEYRAIILLRNVSSDISVDTLISIMDSKGDGEQQKSAAAAGSLFVLLGDNQLSVASKEKVHKSLDQYLETLNKEDPGAVVRMAGLILGVGNDWQVDNKSLDATVRTLADVEETPNIRGMAASLAREILRSHNTSESRIKGETATIMQERLDSYQKENPNGARLSASKAPEQKALTRFFAGLLLAFSLTGIQDKALAIETDSSPTVFTITSNGARLVATSESGLKIELSAQEARGMLSATEDKSETLSIQDIVLVEKTVDTRIAELLKDIDPRTPVVVMVDLRVLPKNAFEAYVSRLATAAIQLKKDNIRVEVVGPQELIDRLSAESVKAFITKLERIQALSEGALLAKLALPNQGGPEATFIPFAQLERGHVPAYAAAARLAAAGARIGKGTIPTGFTDAWAFLAGVEDGLSPDDARQVMKGANKELGARLAIKPLLHARVDVVLREFDMIKRQVQSAA